jgi:hypothetical protein
MTGVAQLLEDDPDFDADDYMSSTWVEMLALRGWYDYGGAVPYCAKTYASGGKFYTMYAFNTMPSSTRHVTLSVYSEEGQDLIGSRSYSEDEIIGAVDRIEAILDNYLPDTETRGLILSFLQESAAHKVVSSLLEDEPDFDADEYMSTPSNGIGAIVSAIEAKGWVLNMNSQALCDFERDASINFIDCILRLILVKKAPYVTCAEVRARYTDSYDLEYTTLVPQDTDTWEMAAYESAESYVARIESDIQSYTVPETDASGDTSASYE